jgi:hypothetical protein
VNQSGNHRGNLTSGCLRWNGGTLEIPKEVLLDLFGVEFLVNFFDDGISDLDRRIDIFFLNEIFNNIG